MPSEAQPIYLVDVSADPVILVVNGRASYLNCAPVGQFFEKIVKQSDVGLTIDLGRCTAMDSTFLGLIAGTALDFRKSKKKRTLTLRHLNTRNSELVQNVGLQHILTIEEGSKPPVLPMESLANNSDKPSADAPMILKAHENLVAIDPENLKKLQDVLTYLKNQVEEG